MFSIAIIGAGQIGSRHLQAISQIDRNVSVQIVDPSAASISICQERFSQCKETHNVQEIKFVNSMDALSEHLDVVIVATSASVRRSVVEALLDQKRVRYLILEKFLFQRMEDFSFIDTLLRQKGVKAWVNCPFRMVPFYQDLKRKCAGSTSFEFSVSGSKIGIGCNSIHYLDLLASFSGQSEFEISNRMLDREVIASKREGFKEFTGTLTGVSEQGSRFSLTSFKHDGAPIVISLITDSLRCLIRENEAKCFISEADTAWEWKETTFAIPFQSQLTHIAVQDILDNGSCDLTSYDESAKLHRQLLKAFLQMEAIQGGQACPIT